MHRLLQLDKKVAVVTGGTGVLGSSMCKTLAAAGATVVIVARTLENAENLATEINQNGNKAIAMGCDVLEKEQLRQVAQNVVEQQGRIDILINGAGGNTPNATAVPGQRSFFDLPQDALQWVFDLNLMGTLLPSQIFGELMARQDEGVIVNLSSMAAFQSLTRVVAYGAAKSAINNFTQWLSVYMAKEHSANIRVNAIAPGFFFGEQNRFLLMNDDNTLTERGQQIIDHTPMNRFGDPDDLSGTLLWLVSDASRFVTGIVVPVDGGFSAFSGV